MEETQATTDDKIEIPDETNDWQLEWNSGGSVRYAANGLKAKLSSHVADETTSAYTVVVTDGMVNEPILENEPDRDAALRALLAFVDDYTPADARDLFDEDDELDLDQTDADDHGEDVEPVVYRVGCDGCDTVHYTIDDLDKCPDCGKKTLESLGFVGDAELAEKIDALDLPDDVDPSRLDAVTAREVLERYGPAPADQGDEPDHDDQGDEDDESFFVEYPDDRRDDVLVLAACSSLKAADVDDDVDESDALPAGDLYRGDMFKKTAEYADAINAPYAILSGKYGVLMPDDVVEHYDVSVYDRDTDEWRSQVVAGAGESGPQGLRALRLKTFDEVRVFAGKAYREPLSDYFDALATESHDHVDVKVPIDDATGIGDMLSKMNDLLDDVTEDDTTEDVEQTDDQGEDGEYPLLEGGHKTRHVDDLPGIGRSTLEAFESIQTGVVGMVGSLAYNVGTPNERHSPDWIERHANMLRRMGAALPDEDALDTLVDALEQAADRKGYDVDELAIDEIVHGFELENDAVDVSGRIESLEDAGLSGREAQVTAWKEQGLTHEAIAAEIGASKSTVDEYSRRAARKLEKARALLATVGDVYE